MCEIHCLARRRMIGSPSVVNIQSYPNKSPKHVPNGSYIQPNAHFTPCFSVPVCDPTDPVGCLDIINKKEHLL